jgi:hypothetical protein
VVPLDDQHVAENRCPERPLVLDYICSRNGTFYKVSELLSVRQAITCKIVPVVVGKSLAVNPMPAIYASVLDKDKHGVVVRIVNAVNGVEIEI